MGRALERSRRGGLARARVLDAATRSAVARRAARARWLRGKTTLEFDRAAVQAFCVRWDVDEVAVFGSAARGSLRPDSDVDVIVDGRLHDLDIRRFSAMKADLEAVFGRPVDLFTKRGVRRWRNELLRRRVLAEMVAVHARA